MWTLVLLAIIGGADVRQIGFGSSATEPAVYELEGYLDAAPPESNVYFTVVLGHGERERTFRITKYRRRGDADPFVLFDNLGLFQPDFILLGPSEPIDAVMSAPAGTRVSGTFVYRRGLHVLEVDPRSLKLG
jgi:hypothetical protein